MSLWEKNTYLLGLGSLIGGLVYFGLVALQSIQLGTIAPPSLVIWLSSIAIQIALSLVPTWIVIRRENSQDGSISKLRGGEDERDRIIRNRSEASYGHFASALIFAAMALWFLHGSVAVLFHSLVAALVLAELLRAAFQLSQYNRAI